MLVCSYNCPTCKNAGGYPSKYYLLDFGNTRGWCPHDKKIHGL